MKRKMVLFLVMLGFFILVGRPPVHALSIDFDGLADLDPVTTQFSDLGVTFSGATVLTSGISLNEFEFPPRSGSNVVLDDGGPMTLTFSTAVTDVGGYFTYLAPVTLSAFDGSGNLLGFTTSSFASNLALSGVSGSSPNEFLQLAFAGGISSLTITGDSLGGSFVLDDLTATPLSAVPEPVPEPGTMLLLGSGLAGVIGYRWKTRRSLQSGLIKES